MGTVTLDEVRELAKQLSPEDRRTLAKEIVTSLPSEQGNNGARPRVNLEEMRARRTAELLASAERATAELKALRESGAPLDEPLAGKYGKPRYDISEEELLRQIKEDATEWEKEIDEFHGQP